MSLFKFLRMSGIVVLSLLTLSLLIVATLWTFPQLLLTPTRVQSWVSKAVEFTEPPQMMWLNLQANGFFGKRVTFTSNHFCLKTPDTCFEAVEINFSFHFVSWNKIVIEQVGPIKIINQSFTLHEVDQKKDSEPKKPSTSSIFDHLEFPPNLKINAITIQFPKVKIEEKGSTFNGNFSVTGSDAQALHLEAEAKSSDGLQAHALIQTQFSSNGDYPIQAILSVKEGFGIDAELNGTLNWAHQNFHLNGKIAIQNLIPWVKSLELNPISIVREKQFKLSSEVSMRLEPKLKFSAADSALPKASFNTEVRGQLNVDEVQSHSSTQQNQYDYRLKLGPLTEKGIHLLANLTGTYPFPRGEEYRYGLKEIFAQLEIPSFQTLVQSLKLTNSAIPAPFSNLQGAIAFKAGQENHQIVGDEVPLELVTDLKSREQAVQTHSGGKIEFLKSGFKNIKITGETKLESIHLTLPHIDPLVQEPALQMDSRIKSTKIEKIIVRKKMAKEKSHEEHPDSSFELNWKVNSNPGAIALSYTLFKPAAPLQMSWNITSDKMTGEIKVLPFDIEYLHRTAHVEYLNYSLREGNPPYHYQGRLVIQKTDYTIYIDVLDNDGKPSIQLTSEPPLDQNDIISVLLFNQTSAEISPDEDSSVANTQSAVENRALGLFSIWALSSTPVEAVNYNASTHVYSARVRLANGLTASVGTDWEKTQEVALRKRLGKNWVLSTVLEQDPTTSEETGKTLLEWFRRF